MSNKFLAKLFTRSKWETLLVTQDAEKYAKAKAQLLDQNISTKTKFPNQNIRTVRSGDHFGRSGMQTIYEIMVRKEDMDKARQALNR